MAQAFCSRCRAAVTEDDVVMPDWMRQGQANGGIWPRGTEPTPWVKSNFLPYHANCGGGIELRKPA